MGYYANGSGEIFFKEKLSDETIEQIKKELSDTFDWYDVGEGCAKGRTAFALSYEDNYHEELIYDTLGAVACMAEIESAEFYFTGEDDSHWKIYYKNAGWCEENGDVVFESDAKESLFVVCVGACYVRDTQILLPPDKEKIAEDFDYELDGDWVDCGGMMYVDCYWAKSKEEAIKKCADDTGYSPAILCTVDTGAKR